MKSLLMPVLNFQDGIVSNAGIDPSEDSCEIVGKLPEVVYNVTHKNYVKVQEITKIVCIFML